MTADRLTRLRDRKAQIEAQLKQLEARERERERKTDTRRKVIAGALALEHAEINKGFGSELYGLLDRYVDRAKDRELFGLPPKSEENEKPDDGTLKGQFHSAVPGQEGPS